MDTKSTFKGTIISIQPRIRLTRSFDEASHTYLGYAIILEGELDNINTTFSIGIGKAAHAKHQFKVNDTISGECVPVPDPDLEPTEYYKVSKLKLITRSTTIINTSSPWGLVPPELEVYRERGHRRLAARTYDTKCSSCMWGARMPVEIIIDNWNPSRKKYRFETFCYGPLNCKLYKAGPNRKVEGRNGMVYVEEDWVDAMSVEHRGEDE
ncbi:MAG TPA: hypothetical protein DCG38_02990 [Eubacteriaceae bacterium]|nr:hypothetical protein [Eubacteriaceae bacterium]